MMADTNTQPYNDLIGRRFGKLTVISAAIKPEGLRTPGAYYLCRCECGGTRVTSRKCLMNGSTSSCGCMHNARQYHPPKELPWRPKLDLTGQRFGILTVTGPAAAPRVAGNHSQWDCVCDCGTRIAVSADSLRKNKVDCGCLTPEKRYMIRVAERAKRREKTLRKYEYA